MSITAIGPATTLDGPLPLPPPHSLLQTPSVLAETAEEDERPRWLNGVNLWGYPADEPSLWDPCATGTFRTKSEVSDQTTERFDPFGVYLPIACSSLGMPEGFEERARVALRAVVSFGVEDAISSGVGTWSNPFFGDSNLTILAAGAAVSAGVGLSYLEDAIGQTGRLGMIHATPAVVAALQAFPTDDEGVDVLVTANGNVVVSGGGYIGADPLAGATPGATEDWVFATWPIEVRLSAMQLVPEDIGDALDTSNNDVVYRAEQYVLATWDTDLQAGVLVDWSL